MLTRRITQLASWLALAALIGPPVAFLAGKIELDQLKTWMLVATIAWFVVTPLWMGRAQPGNAEAAAQ